MIHKITQIERESGVEPKSKPALCHDLLPALAPLFKGQDDKGRGTHCRGVIVETAFLMLLGASSLRCTVMNASGICDEFLWKCNAKERFSFLGSCVFSEDENHLVRPLGLLTGSSKLGLKLSGYLSQSNYNICFPDLLYTLLEFSILLYPYTLF